MMRAVTVLTSGGVESAALLAEALRDCERVYPLYVRKGFSWESAELAHLKRLLGWFAQDGLADLTVLEVPLEQVYGAHWSLGSRRVPGSTAPDAQVYLPGRNLLLLGMAGLFSAFRKIPVVWMGTLKGNPFRDAGPAFLRQMESVLEEALGCAIRIAAPFREVTKAQVIQRWPNLPWQMTISCLAPVGRKHCGRCQKCGERRAGFRAAGLIDPTRYAA